MEKIPFELLRQTFERLNRAVGAAPVETEYSFTDPDLRNGTDDFSITADSGRITFAAGNIRGLFYAVYEYFERYCHCRWFYDGDRIPQLEKLPTENIRFVKHFRYQYRGLRYFAHRSIYRFQAEHWSWSDWQKEIDFLLKKHFSFFMLRTGQDDLFQKAFPDMVPYPPLDGPAPEAVLRSYDDRTELISLQYRGELRKKILDYAFARGLMHPEDMGPMTHWYSHTPKAFLENIAPKFTHQSSSAYSRDELQVWDCDDPENVEYYMQLTRAHIKHYGKAELFHIIGLAERVFGSREENFALKVRVFHNFLRRLREEYPDAPLLIASWDFMYSWKADEVRSFLKELDRSNILVLDYTVDSALYTNNYARWDLPHHFPWIFGIFQAYEPQTDLFFDFERAEEMYIPIQDDPQCKGMVLWSENSHSNVLLYDYLSKRFCDEEFSLERFCRDRYGIKYAPAMQELWQLTQKAFAGNAWRFDPVRTGYRTLRNHFNLLGCLASLSYRNPAEMYNESVQKCAALEIPERFFTAAAELAQADDLTDFIQRDLADLIRTALMCCILRELCGGVKNLCQRLPEKADLSKLTKLVRIMADLLETLPEFSLNDTLEKMAQQGRLNSHAETTLKGNAENNYCRSYIYELYRAIYIPEADAAAAYLAELPAGEYPDGDFLRAKAQQIRDRFYDTKLADLMPHPEKSFADTVKALPEKLQFIYQQTAE